MAPKPTALKKLQGNPGKRALNKNEPMPKGKPDAAPLEMDNRAKACYRKLAEKLAAIGIATDMDSLTLQSMSEIWGMMQEAQEGIRQHGLLIEQEMYGEKRQKKSPYVSIYFEALPLFLQLASRFGMTPADRSKLKVDNPEEHNALEDLILKQA